jgi:hypothetical protein
LPILYPFSTLPLRRPVRKALRGSRCYVVELDKNVIATNQLHFPLGWSSGLFRLSIVKMTPWWGQRTDPATIPSPELDFLVKEARLTGLAGAKMTGAGRGGRMISQPGTVLWEAAFEGFRSKHPNSLISYMLQEGATTWETPS